MSMTGRTAADDRDHQRRGLLSCPVAVGGHLMLHVVYMVYKKCKCSRYLGVSNIFTGLQTLSSNARHALGMLLGPHECKCHIYQHYNTEIHTCRACVDHSEVGDRDTGRIRLSLRVIAVSLTSIGEQSVIVHLSNRSPCKTSRTFSGHMRGTQRIRAQAG